jgi:hypothetical protein
LKDPGKHRSFVFTQANRLFDAAIAQDGNPVDARSCQVLNGKLKLQRDVTITMKARRGLYLQA